MTRPALFLAAVLVAAAPAGAGNLARPAYTPETPASVAMDALVFLAIIVGIGLVLGWVASFITFDILTELDWMKKRRQTRR